MFKLGLISASPELLPVLNPRSHLPVHLAGVRAHCFSYKSVCNPFCLLLKVHNGNAGEMGAAQSQCSHACAPTCTAQLLGGLLYRAELCGWEARSSPGRPTLRGKQQQMHTELGAG